MTEQTTPQRPGTSRRDFLRRGAIVGGTLVWAAPTVQAFAPAALASYAQSLTYTSNGAFTVPSGVRRILVEAWGGGGGGGNNSVASGQTGARGGGGGGAYASRAISVQPGQIYGVFVGTGTTPPSSGNTAAGGDSEFIRASDSELLVRAKGGLGAQVTSGGTGGPAGDSIGATTHAGGNGADASGSRGGGGGGSGRSDGTGHNAVGLAGGSGGVDGGAGGNGGESGNPGTEGSPPGGGGGGRGNQAGADGSKKGADGQVTVHWN